MFTPCRGRLWAGGSCLIRGLAGCDGKLRERVPCSVFRGRAGVRGGQPSKREEEVIPRVQTGGLGLEPGNGWDE